MGEQPFNPFSLVGKTVLVTGASSGIGRAIAVVCSKMGATVILTGRNHRRLEETLSLMSDGKHSLICADLNEQKDIDNLAVNVPVLDGIVQCAGVGCRVLCKFITQNDLQYVFKSNVEAPVLLQTALLSRKKVNRDSSIVFIASHAAESPSIGNAVYSASKGAILSYAKCLALELSPRRIRVNCICPAMVWTDLILQEGISKEELEQAQLKYPLKRYGIPNDVAYLAIYLLSDASSWMTGSSIDLTGGAKEL